MTTTNLDELREKIAEKYGDSADYGKSEQTIFREGWNALAEHLAGVSGEFDMDGFTNECGRLIRLFENEPSVSQLWRRMEGIARWQFEKDRMRIGLAEEIREHAESASDMHNDKVMQLEARLAESEKSADRWYKDYRELEDEFAKHDSRKTSGYELGRRGMEVTETALHACQDKLAAAEQRSKDLHHEMHMQIKTIQRLEAKLKVQI